MSHLAPNNIFYLDLFINQQDACVGMEEMQREIMRFQFEELSCNLLVNLLEKMLEMQL